MNDQSLNHSSLLQLLQETDSVSLPGEEAQYLAVPPNRKRVLPSEVKRAPDTRQAAVLALLHPVEDRTHVALIRRNTYPGVHSDQISFPGGKAEPFDESLMATAVRETHEEIGVGPEEYSVWKPLTEVYIPPSKFLVQPYIGLAKSSIEFTPEEREVVEVLQAPLDFFTRPNALTQQKMHLGQLTLDMPVFDWEGHIIWGATAMMLSELSVLIRSLTDR